MAAAYTIALPLMLIGLMGMSELMATRKDECERRVLDRCRRHVHGDPRGRDHTWTWHHHGLTTPTPGTNPVANTAYAVHMMGMNVIMVGSTIVASRRSDANFWRRGWRGRTLRLPRRRHRVDHHPADDAERGVVVVQRDDDCRRILPGQEERSTDRSGRDGPTLTTSISRRLPLQTPIILRDLPGERSWPGSVGRRSMTFPRSSS